MANHEVTIKGEVVRKHYLRSGRDQSQREWRALVLLDAAAPGLAPRPVAREHDPAVTVMSRVNGHPIDSALTPTQTGAMVAAYRRLFAVPAPPDLPLRFLPPAEFFAANIAWLAQTPRDDHPDVVRRALDGAEKWHVHAPSGIEEIHDPVVAQGDSNVDNMLWDGQRVRLVDFEYAGVGDLAFEVADLVEHASSRLRGLRDPEAVIHGFGLTSEQLDRVAACRVVLATFWLVTLLPGNPGHHRNPLGSAERQADHLLALLENRSDQTKSTSADGAPPASRA